MVNSFFANAIDLHKKNNFSEAAAAYVSIIETDPRNFKAIHYLGLLYAQTGEFDAGVELIKYAIKIAGGYPAAEHNLSALFQFHEAKYLQEEKSFCAPEQFPLPKLGTVGMWRYERMMDFCDLFAPRGTNWLTVGDAFGGDALFLKSKGILQVHASNLEATTLETGFKLGLFDNFHEINAEKIAFEAESFEFVLCKEALHHMPRPYLAIYEMLRVSSEAVFIVEPCDPVIDYQKPSGSPFERGFAKAELGHFVDGQVNYAYEVDGKTQVTGNRYVDWYEDGAFNYVYCLSEREVRKLCFGLGLPAFATKSYNDVYLETENDKYVEQNPAALQQTRERLNWQDKFCELSGSPYNMINAILFKKAPSRELVSGLAKIGYRVVFTPSIFMPFEFVS
jgi:hypothetical protein